MRTGIGEKGAWLMIDTLIWIYIWAACVLWLKLNQTWRVACFMNIVIRLSSDVWISIAFTTESYICCSASLPICFDASQQS